jgi:hypothetical protein
MPDPFSKDSIASAYFSPKTKCVELSPNGPNMAPSYPKWPRYGPLLLLLMLLLLLLLLLLMLFLLFPISSQHSPTLAQINSNGLKLASGWPQDGPKMVQDGVELVTENI